VSQVDLSGKHALVTGAGRGIGRACALALVEAGAGVTLVARSRDELDEVAAEAEAMGGTAAVHPADVGDELQVEAAVDAAARHGGLDITVNCAGINRPGPTVALETEDWDLVMGVNLRGTFLVCRAVGRRLLRDGRPGRIVNMSSQMGSVGYPGRAAYCASKHGVDGLTKALAVEWAKHGITVNAVAPTFVRTPLTEPMLEDADFRDDVLRRIPMGRVGETSEVTGPVLFLSSDAASLVTGHILLVDGGWVAW
jgi:NAD(P)-dependent dehydrogenase (short-subunit alcohol dehydrogenase family)